LTSIFLYATSTIGKIGGKNDNCFENEKFVRLLLLLQDRILWDILLVDLFKAIQAFITKGSFNGLKPEGPFFCDKLNKLGD
jgi:hypothetical protein